MFIGSHIKIGIGTSRNHYRPQKANISTTLKKGVRKWEEFGIKELRFFCLILKPLND